MRLLLTAALSLSICSCSLRLPVNNYPGPELTSETLSEASNAQKTETVEVWMHADTYHTGLIFPYGWLIDSGYIAPEGVDRRKYVIMSWGNTDAYSKQGISAPHGWLQVLFTPTRSVMELVPINNSPPSIMRNQRLWSAQVPADRGPRLAHFLNECTRFDEHGKPVVIRPSSWGEGVQVDGKYFYFIPRVCNTWSCQALESLGASLNPWASMTANGLARQLVREDNGFVRHPSQPDED